MLYRGPLWAILPYNLGLSIMTIEQAKSIVGNRAKWELQAMRKALSMHAWLNTEQETLRLQAVKVLLNNRTKG
jgi:hypothetical protein